MTDLNRHHPHINEDEPPVSPPGSAAERSQPGHGLRENLTAPEFDQIRGKADTHTPTKSYKGVGYWRNKNV